MQANGGIRRGREKERGLGIFSPFSQGSEQTGKGDIDTNSFYLLPPALFSLISVNFDKYIDPKLSTSAFETLVSKRYFRRLLIRIPEREAWNPFFFFYGERAHKYRSDLDQRRTRCISRGSYRERIKAKRATINNLPRPLYTLSAAIKRIDPPAGWREERWWWTRTYSSLHGLGSIRKPVVGEQ